MTASARRVAIVPTNGDDLAVASGSEDVTRRRLEIEQINVDISKTKSTYKKNFKKQQLKLQQGLITTRIISILFFRAFCVPK